jgi:hypothetical protein
MSFLDGYELANDTIIRFRKEYPSGRIITSVEEAGLKDGWILVKAEIFREFEDAVPSAVDYAYGNVATYPQNMKKWFVEDTVTSCISRAIKLLSPTTARASREDMARVEFEATPKQNEPDPWATLTITQTAKETGTTSLNTAMKEIGAQLGGELVAEPARCAHGTMIWKQAAAGSPKNWGGYFCTEKTKATQCPPYWHVLASDGKWKPQV